MQVISAKVSSVSQKQPLYESVPTASQSQKVKTSPEKSGERFSPAELEKFRQELMQMRDRMLSQADSMKDSALKGTEDVNPEEDGTDAHMRLVTLKQVSTQSQMLVKIQQALHAIEKGSYGICDSCGQLIRKQRLQVQPFAKTCIKCQAEMERMRGR